MYIYMSICHENHEMPLFPKFGQLIIKKIIRIVATICQIFGIKMYKMRLRLGLRPRPYLGSLERSPDHLAAFKGPYL